MLVVSLILLGFVVLFGLIVLRSILKNQRTPKPIVLLHGSAALLAILAIASYVASGHTDTLLIISLSLLILAALGGLTLFYMDSKGKPIPKVIAIVHPLIGLSGLLALIIYLFQ